MKSHALLIGLVLVFALMSFSPAYSEVLGTTPDTTTSATSASSTPLNTMITVTSTGGSSVGVLAYCTDLSGGYGAQNTVNTLAADGRFGAITMIDGDVALPTAQFLLDNFQCVIAMTDNRCGAPMPKYIADSAADAMTGFVQGGGGVVVSTFGFSDWLSGGIGFSASIFGPGLSPLLPAPPYYNAPAGSINFVSTTPPCDQLLDGVTSPVSSSYANYVSLASGATLCATYASGQDMLAINAAKNVIGFNSFPADQNNNGQPSYQRMLSNAAFAACSQTIQVTIDIKPGSTPNCFNNNGNGVIPVAIFGSADFNVRDIDSATVNLESMPIKIVGKNNNTLAHFEDINGDGVEDMVVQIQDIDGVFSEGSTTATLTGKLYNGRKFQGADSICIVP